MNKITSIIIFFSLYSASINAQDSINSLTQHPIKKQYQMRANTSEIEANFLSSYYSQEGNNSAVTGGVGTEELDDFANIFTLNIPLNKSNAISIYGGIDAYTSASSDNIDTDVSSASKSDSRKYGTLSYNHKNLNRNESYGLNLGFSTEYDYRSVSGGFTLSKEWNEGNTELNFVGQAFIDKWLGKDENPFIYPELWLKEFFGYEELTDPSRNAYDFQINFTQILSPKLILGISTEVIYMSGLLSTPFHSVYFSDLEDYAFDIERLPSNRIKFPLGIRLNYFPLDFLVLRTNYRYYTDNFGIRANTFEIETPVKISDIFTLSPFFRYHSQSASKYFAPKSVHLSTEEFYTSDYDLSELSSMKYGLGIKYYPLYGIFRSKPFLSNKTFMFKYIELRGAYYTRSTDFTAMNISLNLSFNIQ